MFLVVPQWQGSSSARAMRLVDGANAIRGDLPGSTTVVVDVPLEAGDELGSGVARCGSLMTVRDRMRVALTTAPKPVITIGGDCGVELAAIERAADETTAVVWFDSHPDLNTPETSPSGAFHGMVLRALLGEGVEHLAPERTLDPRRLVLAGARAFDSSEREYIDDMGVACLDPASLNPQAIVEQVKATGATSVYLHIDLDVLDPAEFAGLVFPEPFGITSALLIECVRALRNEFTLAGAGLTEFAPASEAAAADDLPTILRIIAALTR